MEKVELGIQRNEMSTAAQILTEILAGAHVLYIKTRNYHWNIVGEGFYSIHKLLEAQYDVIAGNIDEIAERIRQLGFHAVGTMREFLEISALKEDEHIITDQHQIIKNLLADHEGVCQVLRNGIKKLEETDDIGTADFLTALLQIHEKDAWMLRSHII
ncbi:MAG: DNA starvation/stationary phase protection protein [Bacteroidota bacterium]|nr:DNA starvation/stationary phase protection protein [Bacteroidota bacterium]